MNWSDEDRNRAIRLRKEGLSASEISLRLEERYSRSAVLGMFNRIGLCAPTSRTRWTDDLDKRLRQMFWARFSDAMIAVNLGATADSVEYRRKKLGLHVADRGDLRPGNSPKRIPAPTEARDLQPPSATPSATIFELNAHTCRWPIGDGYCGDTRARGSYCAGHGAMAYRGFPEKKNAVVRA